MTEMTSTLLQAAANYDELEYRVRDAAQHGVESVNSWMDAAWNKTLLILSIAFPVPGDGMH